MMSLKFVEEVLELCFVKRESKSGIKNPPYAIMMMRAMSTASVILILILIDYISYHNDQAARKLPNAGIEPPRTQ